MTLRELTAQGPRVESMLGRHTRLRLQGGGAEPRTVPDPALPGVGEQIHDVAGMSRGESVP